MEVKLFNVESVRFTSVKAEKRRFQRPLDSFLSGRGATCNGDEDTGYHCVQWLVMVSGEVWEL